MAFNTSWLGRIFVGVYISNEAVYLGLSVPALSRCLPHGHTAKYFPGGERGGHILGHVDTEHVTQLAAYLGVAVAMEQR